MKQKSLQDRHLKFVSTSLRKTLWTGTAIVGFFFLGLGGWSAYAPLAGAAIAPAVISPDGERRAVQHLEGGIVKKLLVHEGSEVKVGQPLVVMDSSASRATRDVLVKDLNSNLAIRSRLIAERDGMESIAFPPELTQGDRTMETETLVASQMTLFDSRRGAREQKKKILVEQISQSEQVIVGLTAQIESQTTQLALVREEIAGVAKLVEKGLERKPRLLALQRSEAEILGSRAANQASLAKTRQSISETRAQIESIDTEHKQEVGQKLAEVEAAISGIREKLGAASHVVDRTIVTSPVSGTVVELKANTIGGVVKAGETILEIVPSEEELLVDARISPTDIDEVHAGLAARVVMTGYAQRNTPNLMGSVRQVSADRLVDPRSGQPYYLARIELPLDYVREVAPNISLKPGMPAEVMVITGERTLLDYLVEPLMASVRKSFREN